MLCIGTSTGMPATQTSADVVYGPLHSLPSTAPPRSSHPCNRTGRQVGSCGSVEQARRVRARPSGDRGTGATAGRRQLPGEARRMDSPNLRWPKKSADWHSYTTHEIEKSAGIGESKRGRGPIHGSEGGTDVSSFQQPERQWCGPSAGSSAEKKRLARKADGGLKTQAADAARHGQREHRGRGAVPGEARHRAWRRRLRGRNTPNRKCWARANLGP